LHDAVFCQLPIWEIIEDLQELKKYTPYAERVFITGGSLMAMPFDELKNMLILIRKYLPNIATAGGFAQITDIISKSTSELRQLYYLGLNGISINTDTGNDDVLLYMNKGYTAAQTIKECKKLEVAGIEYHITYMAGLAGSQKGEENAIETAKVFNTLRPKSIRLTGLTISPSSELYKEIQIGNYTPACEFERLFELKTLIEHLSIPTIIYASIISGNTSIAVFLQKDKGEFLKLLDCVISSADKYMILDFRN
jgi:radical SAM superfamily enzyme YgiQ (UPF0313 family)